MLSFAYKWQGEKKVKTCALPDYPGYPRNLENDKFLAKDLHRLLDQCDVVIAHNGDRFDLRKANARFIQHRFRPPSPYRTVDTLKIARQRFKFDSNRLTDLGQYLGCGKKLPTTGSHLWLSCMAGKRKAWDQMRAYNAQDVVLLEAVYDRLKGWATNHPNLSHLSRDPIACPTCESTRTEGKGWKYYATGRKRRRICHGCGHYFMSGQHEKLDKV